MRLSPQRLRLVKGGFARIELFSLEAPMQSGILEAQRGENMADSDLGTKLMIACGITCLRAITVAEKAAQSQV